MNKKDLKNGMWVELESGEIGIYLDTYDEQKDVLIFKDGSWLLLEEYNKDLTFNNNNLISVNWDIVKIFHPIIGNVLKKPISKYSLIWKKHNDKNPKIMSLTEIEDILGYKIIINAEDDLK